jgi:hypothetical protein
LWGCRRIWADWRFVAQGPVKKQRMLRVLRERHRLVAPNSQLKAKRPPPRSNPRPTTPNEGWGIVMPKVLGEGFGWGYIVLVLGW